MLYLIRFVNERGTYWGIIYENHMTQNVALGTTDGVQRKLSKKCSL